MTFKTCTGCGGFCNLYPMFSVVGFLHLGLFSYRYEVCGEGELTDEVLEDCKQIISQNLSIAADLFGDRPFSD